MAISNRERIGKALDSLRDGLLPYISNQLDKNLNSSWQNDLPTYSNNLQDISVLLGLFMEHWRNIFKKLFRFSWAFPCFYTIFIMYYIIKSYFI